MPYALVSQYDSTRDVTYDWSQGYSNWVNLCIVLNDLAYFYTRRQRTECFVLYTPLYSHGWTLNGYCRSKFQIHV